MAGRLKKEYRDCSGSLNDSEKLQWLRLFRTENIGPTTFYHLMYRYGNAENALRALPEITRRSGRINPLKICSRKDAEKELELHEKIGAKLIARVDLEYPDLLNNIPDPPPILSVLGRLDLLKKSSFSIVGARNASISGCQLAEHFSTVLSQDCHFTITSGLARGIDTYAHKGALSQGTISVLAGGIDQVYPPENEELYKKITQQGLLISESPFQMPPHANLFPRRNRIISGLSWGLLVVEAAIKSGSLITARFALEQGREVFAIPGNPLDPRSHGTNTLIKQGAILVQTPQDIIQEYESQSFMALKEEDNQYYPASCIEPTTQEDIDSIREVLLNHMNTIPITINELANFCGASIIAVRTALIDIEIAGYIERHPGDRVSLINPKSGNSLRIQDSSY